MDLVLNPNEEAILAALAAGKAARGATKQVLKEFEGSTIKVLTGRYGPYVNEGRTNASVPKDMDPAKLTLEEAQKILADKKK